jgi:enoyl-CoA hydratase
MTEYSDYPAFAFDRPADGVLRVAFNRPEQYNTLSKSDHEDLARLWGDIARDDKTRVAVVTGSGKAFCAGGSIHTDLEHLGEVTHFIEAMEAARAIVYGLLDCEKPIVSAINGPAAGAGLAVALLADISIIAEETRFTDGHLRIGVAAGDHAAIVWPLLCGLARAKYYLYTAETIDGREAERIGLVSRCVPSADLMATALDVATRLASGPQRALQFTKRSINHWVRAAAPQFEASLALEMLNFLDDDAREGLEAFLAKRPPSFPSARGD